MMASATAWAGLFNPLGAARPLSTKEYLTAEAGAVGYSEVATAGAPRRGFQEIRGEFRDFVAARGECPRPVRMIRQNRDLVTGGVISGEKVKLPCMTKACVVCGPLLRHRFVGHFVGTFKGRAYLRFLTLTLDPKIGVGVNRKSGQMFCAHQMPGQCEDVRKCAEMESRKYIGWCWEKFRKRVARRDDGFAFVAAWEQQPLSGNYHLHVICSANVSADELRKQAFASGFGAQVDVQLLRDQLEGDETEDDKLARKVGYILKYMMKDASGGRSLLCSQGLGFMRVPPRIADAFTRGWRLRHVTGLRKGVSTWLGLLGR